MNDSVNSNSNVLEPNRNSSDIAAGEKQQLQSLLKSFGNLFVSEDGTSVVKHGINTSGNPIRQPIRRQAESLKSAVNTEVGEDVVKRGHSSK